MPRVAGQIDEAKTEAILDAAADVFAERGLAAPMEAIARRAGVSKQTLYNRYRSKNDLVRALVIQKSDQIIGSLHARDAAAPPREVLADFARNMLNLANSKSPVFLRTIIQSAGEMPDLAQEVFEAGPLRSRLELAAYLAEQTRLGRLSAAEPEQAAEFFAGMVTGQRQLRALLGLNKPMASEQIDRLAQEAADRFVKAYAP
ncbi:TetR/AcrR family transcriptional regulator [Caulobacter segnis]|uniref:TetR/AcrR family transcriptional regulator n=1 Tax=Caulobacter segnis TaxID=88688 RepID=UPI00241046D1|nr:TetR/AcrR family transcriptional regulator [Caulobacter segnis]MDG2521466.1 TetR/AcrR family transcriptional regulator [Caulobacter segnis]